MHLLFLIGSYRRSKSFSQGRNLQKSLVFDGCGELRDLE